MPRRCSRARARRATGCAATKRMLVLIERLKARPIGPTIVYVTLQKTAETVAAALIEAGFSAEAYHAGMEAEAREAAQNRFMAADDRIVVATIAFGMGIDKANIRAVYHYNLPKSLENYAQEIGRAGLQCAVAEIPVLIDRDHDDRDIEAERQATELSDKGVPVHAEHLVVGDDEVGRVVREPFDGCARIGEGADVYVLVKRLRQLDEDIPVRDPVVDDDDMRHRALSFTRPPPHP